MGITLDTYSHVLPNMQAGGGSPSESTRSDLGAQADSQSFERSCAQTLRMKCCPLVGCSRNGRPRRPLLRATSEDIVLEEELQQLQIQMAWVDFHPDESDSSSDTTRLLLFKKDALKIKMYQETGHALPHIHIDYGRESHTASYSLDGPTRLAGTLSRKYERVVVDWITEHKAKLIELWETVRAGKDATLLLGDLRSDS